MWNFQVFPITIYPFTAFSLLAYQSSIMGALVISRNSQMPTMILNPIYPTVAFGAYLLGGVYAAVGYIGFNVMVGVWLFREITRAPMMDD